MSSWFRVNLGDAMLASRALAELEASLWATFDGEGRPEAMVAVYRHESGGLHCNLVVYLSSEFQRAAMLKGAVTCIAPPLSGSGFLAGDETSYGRR